MIKKITASEKKKLKERLSKLNRELCNFYKYYKYTYSVIYAGFYKSDIPKLEKLDQKRKEIRNKLK